jgi:hypothetical protein
VDNSEKTLSINDLRAEKTAPSPVDGLEFAQQCATLGIKARELAAWEGVTVRAARYWLTGVRPVPGSLALLVSLLAEQPWLLASVRRSVRPGQSSQATRARVL